MLRSLFRHAAPAKPLASAAAAKAYRGPPARAAKLISHGLAARDTDSLCRRNDPFRTDNNSFRPATNSLRLRNTSFRTDINLFRTDNVMRRGRHNRRAAGFARAADGFIARARQRRRWPATRERRGKKVLTVR